MRTKFNLDTQILNGFSLMVHADRAVGKTHLLGDALATEMTIGPVKYINVAGEDGMLTISAMGLGNVGETITEYKDFIEITEEYAKSPLQAIALDSLPMLAKLAMRQVTGSDRLPVIPNRDQLRAGMTNEWPEVHRLMESAIVKLKRAAKYVLVAAASDKAMDMLDMSGKGTPTLIAPNLPGKEASDSAGWFDFVGYMQLKHTRPGEFKRTFSMVPDGVTRVRQRVPNLITTAIELPVGRGGWVAIKTAIESASRKESKP